MSRHDTVAGTRGTLVDPVILHALQAANTTRTVSLTRQAAFPGLDTQSLVSLARVIARGYDRLVTVNLCGQRLCAESCAALCRAAHDGASFRVLDCGDCDIGDTAASALADLIILNDNLQRVYLPNNRIRTEGATALAGALIARPGERLKTVDLSFNPLIGNGGACALAAALRTTAPEELRISHCGACVERPVALVKPLQRKDSLNKLHLDGNALRAATQLLLAKLATEADVTLTLFS